MKKAICFVVRKISAEMKIKFQIRYLYLRLTISSSFCRFDIKMKLEDVGTWKMSCTGENNLARLFFELHVLLETLNKISFLEAFLTLLLEGSIACSTGH